ncbi:MAG: ferredoxin [Gammaproteobacteria bacterium]|nr:ferredoxin [Gammaproteobacteria bacterium]
MSAPVNSPDTLPALPTAIKDARSTKELMHTLRHFHMGVPKAKEELESAGENFLPALLNPFRDASRMRYDYPLFLYPPDTANGTQETDKLAEPLSGFLQKSVDTFAPGKDSARILKDNLPRLERDLRQRLAVTDAPQDASQLLAESMQGLQDHLRLDDENRGRLQGDLDKLLEATPVESQLIGYGRYTALYLLIHAIRSRIVPRRARFNRQLEQYIRELKTLLEVERHKSANSRTPDTVRDTVGTSVSHFDISSLSSVMEHSHGSIVMSAERHQRIEAALATIEAHRDDPILVRFVHKAKLADTWLEETSFLEVIQDDNPCAQATAVFDREAEKLAKVFSAARIAQLEIEGVYDENIHDPWFTGFNWEAFSPDELLLVPAVIALEDANLAAGSGMRSFSRLLSSGRPVHIFTRVLAHHNPGAIADENPFESYRTELGYFGISHRQAVITQSSAARYQHLLDGYLSALEATRTSLHIINIGLRQVADDVGLNAWLVAGAALEGRAHPFFTVNPTAGDTASVRMNFSGNPQPNSDWPIHPFSYQDENGETVKTELTFTFADYCLLLQKLREHFRLVPPECDSDDLIPLVDYLALSQDQASQYVPFILAINENGSLRKLAVSRTMVHACQDRRNYWRTLQELAGIRNQYVEMAVRKTREEIESKAAAEHERLEAEYQQEIERVRKEEAGEAMQRLTDVLLGLDLSGSLSVPAARSVEPSRPAPEAAPTADEAPEPEVAEEEEEEEISFDEPFIDTPLCTSCNDCINLNQLLFVYDENKQALIGDVNAGTFAQLVEAAEICPAKCIHPGKPLNQNEPGLDDLIERAKPFN